MINRRNFLKNASLFTLGGLMAGKVGNAVAAQPATSAAVASKAASYFSDDNPCFFVLVSRKENSS